MNRIIWLLQIAIMLALFSCNANREKAVFQEDSLENVENETLQIDYTAFWTFRLQVDNNKLQIMARPDEKECWGELVDSSGIVYKEIELNRNEIDSIKTLVSQIDDAYILKKPAMITPFFENSLTINNELVYSSNNALAFKDDFECPSIHRLIVYLLEFLVDVKNFEDIYLGCI